MRRPDICIEKECQELRTREGVIGALKTYCALRPDSCIVNIRTCPKEESPLKCETCRKEAEECIFKYNSCYNGTGCASHTGAIEHILSNTPSKTLLKELIRRGDAKKHGSGFSTGDNKWKNYDIYLIVREPYRTVVEITRDEMGYPVLHQSQQEKKP